MATSRELRYLERQSLRHTLAFGLEAGSVWCKPLQYGIRSIRRVVNQQLLERAMQSDKGVIVLLPHLGNWEMANQFLAPLAKVVALYKPHQNPLLNDIILNARSRSGVTMMPTNRRGVAAINRHLKAGGVTVILPDQVPDSTGGLEAPFFEQPTASPTLVAKLARNSGAQLLSLVCARLSDGTFEVIINQAPAGIAADNLLEAVTTMNRHIEQLILRFPSQYQWSYKRFKRRS